MQFFCKVTTESEPVPPFICELLCKMNTLKTLGKHKKGRGFEHSSKVQTQCNHLIWSKKSCENKSICKSKLDFICALVLFCNITNNCITEGARLWRGSPNNCIKYQIDLLIILKGSDWICYFMQLLDWISAVGLTLLVKSSLPPFYFW